MPPASLSQRGRNHEVPPVARAPSSRRPRHRHRDHLHAPSSVGAAPAQAHPAGDRAVSAGATWLKAQLTDGIVVGQFDTFVYDDFGLSADIAFALDAVGGQDATVVQVADAVAPRSPSGTTPSARSTPARQRRPSHSRRWQARTPPPSAARICKPSWRARGCRRADHRPGAEPGRVRLPVEHPDRLPERDQPVMGSAWTDRSGLDRSPTRWSRSCSSSSVTKGSSAQPSPPTRQPRAGLRVGHPHRQRRHHRTHGDQHPRHARRVRQRPRVRHALPLPGSRPSRLRTVRSAPVDPRASTRTAPDWPAGHSPRRVTSSASTRAATWLRGLQVADLAPCASTLASDNGAVSSRPRT